MTKTFVINGQKMDLFVSGESLSSAGLPVFIVSKVAGSPFTFSILKSAAAK